MKKLSRHEYVHNGKCCIVAPTEVTVHFSVSCLHNKAELKNTANKTEEYDINLSFICHLLVFKDYVKHTVARGKQNRKRDKR